MFTIEEIELLMRGLDSIEKQAQAVEMVGELLTSVLSKDPAHAEEINKARAERQRQMEGAQRQQKFRVNVLKGKLAELALRIEQDEFKGCASLDLNDK